MLNDILTTMRSIGLVPKQSKHPKRRYLGPYKNGRGDVVQSRATGKPMDHFTHYDNSRYTGQKLRQLRAERGVGNPRHIRAAG